MLEARAGVRGKQTRLSVLEKVRGKLQLPPLGPFNRDDIVWEKQHNSGCGGQVKDVVKAVFPWNKLQDFVEGESNSMDFPYVFNQKKWQEVPMGSREVAKEATYTQKIR
jgi:hypothetical protein